MGQETDGPESQPAVVTMTIHITRKATGVTETYELIGTQAEEIQPDDEVPPWEDKPSTAASKEK